MSKFIVTYGDRVVLDYKSDSEGVHKTFPVVKIWWTPLV